jgi:hypothetical protein
MDINNLVMLTFRLAGLVKAWALCLELLQPPSQRVSLCCTEREKLLKPEAVDGSALPLNPSELGPYLKRAALLAADL